MSSVSSVDSGLRSQRRRSPHGGLSQRKDHGPWVMGFTMGTFHVNVNLQAWMNLKFDIQYIYIFNCYKFKIEIQEGYWVRIPPCQLHWRRLEAILPTRSKLVSRAAGLPRWKLLPFQRYLGTWRWDLLVNGWVQGKKNIKGTPNWLVYTGKSQLNGWFGGTPISGNQTMVFLPPNCVGLQSKSGRPGVRFSGECQIVEANTKTRDGSEPNRVLESWGFLTYRDRRKSWFLFTSFQHSPPATEMATYEGTNIFFTCVNVGFPTTQLQETRISSMGAGGFFTSSSKWLRWLMVVPIIPSTPRRTPGLVLHPIILRPKWGKTIVYIYIYTYSNTKIEKWGTWKFWGNHPQQKRHYFRHLFWGN